VTDREALIFVQPQGVDWATTVLGELAAAIRAGAFDWCWATKYGPPWGEDAAHHNVPESFKVVENGSERGVFVKLRYRSDDPTSFETQVRQVAEGCGWHAVFADYDLVADLGTDRFLAQEQGGTPTRRRQRAERLVAFLHEALLLALDTLVKDGNDWRFERSTHQENPTGTTFQSVVHLVCNLTDARTQAAVRTPVGTFVVPVSF
jgi:cytochrome P450